MKDGNVQTLPVVVPTDLMREIGMRLYVGGVAEGEIQISEGAVRLSRGSNCRFEYFSEPHSPEREALSPVAVNYDAITSNQGMLMTLPCRPWTDWTPCYGFGLPGF